MHSDVSLLTYTDFGQNKGRYASGPVNALLHYIREQEGGVTISYTGGQPTYTMLHGMIDFSSQCDGGYGAAIGYNWYATVQHNGVHNNTYTGNAIGSANAVHYAGIEYRSSNAFLHTPSNDYKITRQSKIITDVTGSAVYGSENPGGISYENNALTGELLYRSGSGTMALSSHNSSLTPLSKGYTYITGGISAITSNPTTNAEDQAFSIWVSLNPTPDGVSHSAPLPFTARTGDSGSPTWVWNKVTEQYEYLNAVQSGGTWNTQARGATVWTVETMASYDKKAVLGEGVDEVHIGAVNRAGDTITDAANNVSTTLYWGDVTDAGGNRLQEFRGVQAGINTWRDLSPILGKSEPWYAYGADYLNANPNGQGKGMSYADIFNNDNLVFVSDVPASKKVIVDADVDLGIGYVQFSKAEGVGGVSYTVASASGKEGGGDYLLNSAGYVVDEGVSLHVQLTGAQEGGYLREWRKIGDGDLYLEGTGDNYILLNLGGNGATYLQRQAAAEGGSAYAAYNVLANNGTTVVISDINQIKHDFTFGYRGAKLDMNGNSMVWNNGNDAAADGFTIHALDEHAIITNASGHSSLTWTQQGKQEHLGSFADTSSGSLRFIYQGGAGSELTLHSIHTDLTHNAGSGMEVASGKVILTGINGIAHGKGSLTGTNAAAYSHPLDWHYADMSAHVRVKDGATFELGSHARLSGNVTVESGGSFIMREGVQQQYEYVEGGYVLEDTSLYRHFFGLKGNITLDEGSSFKVEFSEGATSPMIYEGQISGGGTVEITLGTLGGSLTLVNKEGAESSFSGAKRLLSGTLIANSNSALGDTSAAGGKWVIDEKAVLASHGFTGDYGSAAMMASIDSSSKGVLALTENRTAMLDVSNHQGLYIGALEGKQVHYGSHEASLAAIPYAEGNASRPEGSTASGYWKLGGGGGELIVDFKLTGNNDLILGNEWGKGSVTLTHAGNDFMGSIFFHGAITLDYTEAGAIGNGQIALDYATRIPALTNFKNIHSGANGVLLLTENSKGNDFNMSGQPSINLATEGNLAYTGALALQAGAAYRFGGGSGTLLIESALEKGHDLVLDGQTYSGGCVSLRNLQSLDGSIYVMGYDSGKTSRHEGDVTLKLMEGQSIKEGQLVSLKDGGILDLAGTSQTFNQLNMEAGSFLTDSSLGHSSVTLSAQENLSLYGDISIASLAKEGSGEAILGGNNSFQTLLVNEGSIRLASDTALASGMADFNGQSSLVFGGHTADAAINLNGATADATAGGGIAEHGYLLATADGSILNTAPNSTFRVHGSIAAKEGTTLRITGGGNVELLGSSINGTGGTLEFTAPANIKLGTGAQSFGGTISLKGGSAITNIGGGASFSFDTLHVNSDNGGQKTSLTAWGRSWSYSSWTIVHLNGSGILSWDPANYHYNVVSGSLRFTGEGNFSGIVQAIANGGWVAVPRYVELTHDKALQNASLELQGKDKMNIALAINTANAHLKGLSGTHPNACIYAGAVGSASAVPTSSRTAILTLAPGEGETYSFMGSVGINDRGTDKGISLAKEGKGTQNFDGSDIILNHLDVRQGTLAFGENANLSIRGDISLNQGATLSIAHSGGLTLGSGQTLGIHALADSQQSATLRTQSLALNGGGLAFSAESFIKTGSTALDGIGVVSVGEGITSLTINLFDTTSLRAGTYTLASGNWSAASGLAFTTTGLDYLEASYNATDTGLLMTVVAKDGNYVWNGTETAYSWSTAAFGPDTIAPGSGHTAIFNDVAAVKGIALASGVEVGTALFDNTLNYAIAGNGHSITAESIDQRGQGETSIDAAVTVGSLLVEDGTLRLQQGATISQSIAIKGDATLDIANLYGGNTVSLSMGKDATLSFGSDTPANLALGSLSLETGGSITINKAHITVNNPENANRSFRDSTTIRLNGGSVLDDRATTYRTTNANVSLEGDGTLYIKGLRLSEDASSTISSLSIAQGSTLVITGESIGKDGAFALSHWNTNGNVLNIEGTLTSNAPISSWDASAAINVRQGGTLNLLKGITRNTDRSESLSITIGEQARINASGGVRNRSFDINLQAGSTLGAIGDNATFSNDFSLGTQDKAGTVTIDTHYSSVATDGSFAVTQGTDGGNISLTGNIGSFMGATLQTIGSGTVSSSGSLAIGGNLNVADTSTLNITGALSVLGSITVSDGATLSLTDATIASDLVLNSNSSMSISGQTSLAEGMGITNNGSITLSADTAFHLIVSDLDHAEYTIINGGSITYGPDGKLPSIFVNGFDLSVCTDIMTVTHASDRLAIILQATTQKLAWNGDQGNKAWSFGSNSGNWLTEKGEAASFKSLSDVIFGAGGESHAVDISGHLVAKNMEITAGSGDTAYHFIPAEGSDGIIQVAENMEIHAGSEASFGADTIIGGELQVKGKAMFSQNLAMGGGITVTGELGLTAAAATDSHFRYALDASQGTVSIDTQGATLHYKNGRLAANNLRLSGGGSLDINLGNNLSLNNVELGANTTLAITDMAAAGDKGKALGQLTMGHGSRLSFAHSGNQSNATFIAGINLSNRASATVIDNRFGVGIVHVSSLSGSGNLLLSKGSEVPYATVFHLGENAPTAGNFSGTINLNQAAPSPHGTARPASLVLSHGSIAQNAAISLTATRAASAAQLGLGIHADNVAIAGLESQNNVADRTVVYSGTATTGFSVSNGTPQGISDDQVRRTLTINTAEGASHTYYGKVHSHLNLAIGGAGTQAFAGTSDAFDGNITLTSGTLSFAHAGAAAMLSTAGRVQLDGGTLDLSALGFTTDSSHAISLGEHSSLSFGSGIKLNLGQLDYGTYHIFAGGQAQALQGWESLTKDNVDLSHGATYSPKVHFSFSAADGTITVAAPRLIWNGSSADSWNNLSDNNIWLAGQEQAAFENYDQVLFTDSGTKEVAIDAGGVTAMDMEVEGTNYTFSGGSLAVREHVNISGSATFHNRLDVQGGITVTGELGLTAASTADSHFSYALDASQGTVSIDTQKQGLTYNGGSLAVNTLRLSGGGSLDTNLNGIVLNNVELGNNTALTITNQAAGSGSGKTLGSISMASGSTLAFYDANQPSSFTSIGSIRLEKGAAATVTDKHHATYVRIGSLSGSGTLNFDKLANSAAGSIYELGERGKDAGSFSGKIGLKSSIEGSRRSATLLISHGDIAKDAVISLGTTQSGDATLGLGIHDSLVKIAGLESQSSVGNRSLAYSGTLAANTELISQSNHLGITDTSTRRTLSINTAKGASHTYYGKVHSHLNLAIGGAGTQAFAGTSDAFDGDITLTSGTLSFAHAGAAAMLSTAGRVQLDGGTLDLSALGFTTDSGHAISLGEHSSLSFGSGIKINLGQLDCGTYHIFAGGQAQALQGWESLTLDNLVFSGAAGHSAAQFSLVDGAAKVTISSASYELVWEASQTNGTWEQTSSNWSLGDNASNFANGDTVSFNSSAQITVADGIRANKATVSAGAEISLSKQDANASLAIGSLHIEGTLATSFGIAVDTISSAEGSQWKLLPGTEQNLTQSQLAGIRHLHVDRGATLALSGSALPGFALDAQTRLTGDGTVTVSLSNDPSNAIHTGSEFSGTAYATTGSLLLDKSTPGSALRLADGVNVQLSSDSGKATYEKGLIIEGTSDVNQNGRDLAISGKVAGEGTYRHTGGGNLTFENEVDLGGIFVELNASTTSSPSTAFNGDKTTVGNVTNHHPDGILAYSTISFNSKETTIKGDISNGAPNIISFAGSEFYGTDVTATITDAVTTVRNPETGEKSISIRGRQEGVEAHICPNSLILLAENTSLELKDVRMGKSASIQRYSSPATVVVSNTTIEAPSPQGSTQENIQTTTISEELCLTQTGTARTVTVDKGKKFYTISLSSFQNVNFTGDSLCFDLSAIISEIPDGADLLCLSLSSNSTFTGLEDLSITASNGIATFSSRDTSLAGYYETGLSSSPVIYFDLNNAVVPTPEPTTATLGLAALAALAARRRRRA